MATHNEISGEATTAVQAGVVHGGVHVGAAQASPGTPNESAHLRECYRAAYEVLTQAADAELPASWFRPELVHGRRVAFHRLRRQARHLMPDFDLFAPEGIREAFICAHDALCAVVDCVSNWEIGVEALGYDEYFEVVDRRQGEVLDARTALVEAIRRA
ncbi:hypothetical protein [Kitasatospora griseola]